MTIGGPPPAYSAGVAFHGSGAVGARRGHDIAQNPLKAGIDLHLIELINRRGIKAVTFNNDDDTPSVRAVNLYGPVEPGQVVEIDTVTLQADGTMDATRWAMGIKDGFGLDIGTGAGEYTLLAVGPWGEQGLATPFHLANTTGSEVGQGGSGLDSIVLHAGDHLIASWQANQPHHVDDDDDAETDETDDDEDTENPDVPVTEPDVPVTALVQGRRYQVVSGA